MSYIDFLANSWTLKRPQKVREGNQSGSWSNFWKGRADYAVPSSIPGARQSSLLLQIIFSVLFCTLWCQAELQQVSELHSVAGNKTTKTWECLWEVSATDCLDTERESWILGNRHVYTYIQYLYLLRKKYKREQYLSILLRHAVHIPVKDTFFLITCILKVSFLHHQYYFHIIFYAWRCK